MTGIRRAVAVLRTESRRVLSWTPRLRGSDPHAGRTETSLMLHIAPGLVGPERPNGPTPLYEALVTQGVRRHSENGVLGDAAGAGAEEGASLLAQLVADLAATVDGWVHRELLASQETGASGATGG
jgi:creatinine amidohydrolase